MSEGRHQHIPLPGCYSFTLSSRKSYRARRSSCWIRLCGGTKQGEYHTRNLSPVRLNRRVKVHSILNTTEHRQICSKEIVDHLSSLGKLRRFIFQVKRLRVANAIQTILKTSKQGTHYVLYKAYCYFACCSSTVTTVVTIRKTCKYFKDRNLKKKQ